MIIVISYPIIILFIINKKNSHSASSMSLSNMLNAMMLPFAVSHVKKKTVPAPLLTIAAHAQRGLQYLVCVSVRVCVCVSVTQHLTFHVIICATNDTNLLISG